MTKEEAIQILTAIDTDGSLNFIINGHIAMSMAIEALQEKKTGHWVMREIRMEQVPCCSVCGCGSGTLYKYSYCPECGAKMENKND